MLQDIRPFQPAWKLGASITATLAVTNANQNITVPSAGLGTANARAGYSVRLVNSGNDIVFVNFGAAASAASGNSMPLLPNSVETFWLNPGYATVGVIGVTGGLSTLYLTYGEGA